jgi:hypothetical protein
MQKVLSILNRMALIAGVLIALTPCGICHPGMGQGPSTCSMKTMSGKKDCCHKEKHSSPLCKVMDQSSTVAAAKSLDAAPAQVSAPIAAPVLAFIGASVLPSVVLDTSPFRAPLSLRI